MNITLYSSKIKALHENDESKFDTPVCKIAEWTGRRPVMHLS